MAEIVAGLVVSGVTEILKKLVPVVAQSIASGWGVKSDLKKLKSTLETIEAVIADAEERQVNEKAVRLWMKRLKDAAYDADDVLDDYKYEAMRKSDEMRTATSKVRNLGTSSNRLIFSFTMASKIRNINANLEAIAKDMRDFSFSKTVISNNTVYQSRDQLNRISVSSVVASEIVGRDHDKSEILKLLVMTNNMSLSSSSSLSSGNDSSCTEKISVISIVGMGGVGKTALAQLVYNDESVVKHFEPRVWVCVSDVFDVYIVLANIMESITKEKCPDFSNKDVLVDKIQNKLKDKKYLIVLDDFWNENIDNWQKLKTWLDVGAHGSKILVTTRLDKVASIVRGMIPPYCLQQLSADKCWSIIERKAFSPGVVSKTENMINLGMEIAEKCCGLPLVANFLGGLMHSKNRESDWESIRDQNGIWNISENQGSVIPILKLSYDNLPSHLKQCFSYCAIFPKDWDIERETLIRLWMAEGFLPPSDENGRSIENIGNEYFESLLWSSFFQDAERNVLGDIVTCKMHDLVHDLAQKVVGKHELSIVKVKSEMDNVSDIRRLLLDFDDECPEAMSESNMSVVEFPKALYNEKKLRTVVDFRLMRGHLDLKSVFCNKQLRVLHFDGLHFLVTAPSTISKLRHLRYLYLQGYNLRSHGIMIQSISNFYNLQTLVLCNCVNAKFYLPRNIGSLINLRYLDVSHTYIQVLPDSITSLSNLRHLDVSNTMIEVLPDPIASLCNLRTLRFHNCENLKEMPSDFGQLKHLRFLHLEGTKIEVLPESCSDNLTNLEIVNLGDKCKVPKGINNWTRVRHLIHCGGIDFEMPRGIEQLTSLKVLKSYVVRKQDDVTTEPDHEGSSGIEVLHGLNLLEELTISLLENVRGPIDAERANLKGKSNIRKLELNWSPEDDEHRSNHDVLVLEALQPHPNLKELVIWGFMGSKLPTWMGGVSSCLLNLEKMILVYCTRCEQLPALGQLPHLRDLVIATMDSVKRLGNEFYFDVGESSDDAANNNVVTAPPISLFFPSLIKLTLDDMISLEEFVAPQPPPSRIDLASKFPDACSFPLLEKMVIRECPKLTIAPTLFPCLKDLILSEKNGTRESLNSIARGLTSLTSLRIENLSKLIYFPRGLLRNNTCLRDLGIWECENFLGFDLDGDITAKDDEGAPSGTQLNICCSLQRLALEDCPVLQFLPDLQGWTTLRQLTIKNCNELKKSLPNDPKSLSFIEDLDVDFWKE